MAKYVFFNFPAYGHVNPTLAIVEELIARGEEVVYYLPERFRQMIEAKDRIGFAECAAMHQDARSLRAEIGRAHV